MGIKIAKIDVTNDKISAREGGLRYIERIGLYLLISGKGLQLQEFLKQIFAYFIDGTNMAMNYPGAELRSIRSQA